MLTDLESASPAPGCVHRWLLATPAGDLCTGICRLCGAERCFTNERYAFGRPARNRRAVLPVKPALIPRTLEPGALARFLTAAESLTNDGLLPAP